MTIYGTIALISIEVVLAGAQVFVSTATAPASSRPLGRGIADIEARIEKNRELAAALQDAVQEHVGEIGEIVYEGYGQKGDPLKELMELRSAYKDVHSATINGVTGQVWPAVGQLGQAILDGWSETMPWVSHINVAQKVTWETARLRTTLSELDGYKQAIVRDESIRDSLVKESNAIEARQSQNSNDSTSDVLLPNLDDPILAITPPGEDLSALDEVIKVERWLDLGNRAFDNAAEENAFYDRFPWFQTFRAEAEWHSPRNEVERAAVSQKDLRSPSSGPSSNKPDDFCAKTCAGSNSLFCDAACSK